MENSPRVKEALRKAMEELEEMSNEELRKKFDEHEKTYVPDPVFEKWITEALALDELDPIAADVHK